MVRVLFLIYPLSTTRVVLPMHDICRLSRSKTCSVTGRTRVANEDSPRPAVQSANQRNRRRRRVLGRRRPRPVSLGTWVGLWGSGMCDYMAPTLPLPQLLRRVGRGVGKHCYRAWTWRRKNDSEKGMLMYVRLLASLRGI